MKKFYFINLILIAGLLALNFNLTAQEYNVTTTSQCVTAAGGSTTVSFSGTTPNANGAATLTLYYNGDLNGTTSNPEFLDIFGETGPSLGLTNATNLQCGTPFDSTVYTISMADINAWAASGGQIDILVDADATVGSICSGNAFCVYGKLIYPQITGPNDAGATNISPSIVCSGTLPVFVDITNYGTNQINPVTVNWMKNGVLQTPITYSSILDTIGGTGSTTATVSLGSHLFSGANTFKVWTSMPNLVADTSNANDTVTATITPSMSGTYTIDAGSPISATNYQSVSAALLDLQSIGVCGPVVFNVASGSGPYIVSEDVSSIIGSSSINTVTFNGNGNTINHGGGSYFLALDGIKHFTINNFMFVNETPSSNVFGILLRGGCDSVTIKNNTIDLGTTVTSTLSCGIVSTNSLTSYSSYGDNANNLTIDSNTLIGGYLGIRLNGVSTAVGATGNKITNNIIKDYYVYGVFCYYADDLLIHNNDFSRPTRSTITTFYGIYAYYSTQTIISNNKIYDAGSGSYTAYPIYFGLSSNSLGSESYVVNNAIYNLGTTGTGTVYGMYLLSTMSYVNVWHNTIEINTDGSTGTTRGIFRSTSPNNEDYTNNLISITGSGTGTKYCFYTNSSTTFTGSNNLFHMAATGGTNYNSYYSANQTTIADWNTATSTAGNTDGDPMMVTGTYIPTTASDDNGGIPLALVPTDIDGGVRSLSTPDFGAVEFSPPTCPASSNLAGFNPTGTTHDVTWTPGTADVSWIIEYGAPGFTPGTGTSVTSMNDTLTLTGLSPTTDYEFYVRGFCALGDTSIYIGSQAIRTVCLLSLSGTYTVDPSLPASATNFVTTDSLFQTLENCGISGPTTVNFATGSGPYIFDWDLNGVAGLGPNTLTLNGNGVTVNRGTGTYFLALDGISKLTIENFMFINETPNNQMYGIMMRNVCDSINIQNNTIDLGTGYTTSLSCGICATSSLTSPTLAGDNANNITIDNNTIIGAYYGIAFRGTSTTIKNTGHRITNNTIQDAHVYSIYNYGSDNFVVKGNDISRPTRTTLSTFYGVYSAYTVNDSILNNKIHDAGTGNYTNYAIYFGESTNTASQHSVIANNAIYDNNASGTQYPIYLWSTQSYVDVHHNTVSINADGGSGTIRGIYPSSTPDNLDVTNNLVTIKGSGTGTKYCYYSNSSTTFTGGNNLFHMGSTSGTNYNSFFSGNQATIADWSTASSTSGNISNNPVIVAPGYTPFSNMVDNLGTPLALPYLATDVDGTTRSATTPDMGAVEFIPTGGDLSILSGGLSRVSDCYGTMDTAFVYLKNLFGDTIDLATNPITITFNVTGPVNTSVTTVVNTDTLFVTDTLKVINTTIDMSLPGKYSITAYIDFALNNILDGNDTLISIDEVEVIEILALAPMFDTLYSVTDSSKLTAQSPFFAAGSFFISEICQYAGISFGQPTAGRPAWLQTDDYIEITGVPGSDLAGYTFEQWNDGVTGSLQSTYTFPSGTVLSPNGTAIIATSQLTGQTNNPSQFIYLGNGAYTGTNSSGGRIGKVIKDASGVVIDAVAYNGSTTIAYIFPTASGVTAADWSAPLLHASNSWGIRLTGPDNNTGSNWVISTTTPQDPNTLNAGVSLPTAGAVAGITWTDLTTSTVLPDTTPEIQVKGIFTANGTYPVEIAFITPCGTFRDTSYITVYNQVYDTTIINECDSFILPVNGAIKYATGIYTDTLVSTGTVPTYDSIYYVYDINIDTTNAMFTLVECDSFVSPSGKVWNTTGVYNDTITNSFGCDSLMVFNITMNFASTGGITTTKCDTFIAPSGAVFRSTGMYLDTIMNVTGCDSVITVNLTILNSTTFMTSRTVCDSFVAPTGVIWTTTGIYNDTLTNSIGCDSIIVFNLTVNNSSTRTDNIALCAGIPHRVGPTLYTVAGTYTDVFTNFKGCDSTIITNLTYFAPAVATVNYNFCSEDSVQILGSWYYSATTFMDTIVGGSSNGCDSITTHNITTRTVTPALNLGSDVTACVDGGVTIFASTAYDTYNWSTGATTNVLSVTGASSGVGSTDYILTVTQASSGCTARDTVNITFNSCVGVNELDADLNVNLYPNPASDFVTIEIFDKYNTGNLKLEILNSIGQVVTSRSIENSNERVIMDVNNFSKGLYLVRISSDRIYMTKKLLIQK